MSSERNWRRAQRIERRYQSGKDFTAADPFVARYGRRLLAELPQGWLDLGPESRVLDVGCGGLSILRLLDAGVRVGLDPLMELYLERSPGLRELPVRWVEGALEAWEPEAPFDLIFSLNMLDHTRDPAVTAGRIASWLAPGGHLVCALNVHLSRFWRGYYGRLYRWVDRPHPHHLMAGEVPGLFPSLRLVREVGIDSLWLDLRPEYDRSALGRRRRSPVAILKNLANPFKYPIGAAELLFGRPFHRRHPDDRPLVEMRLYLFSAPAAH